MRNDSTSLCPQCGIRPVGKYSKTGMCRPCAVSAGKIGIDGRSGDGPNPSGLCMCGCGERAPLARWNRATKEEIAGKPKRFLPGHKSRLQTIAASRGMPEPNPSGLCLCGCGQRTTIAPQTHRGKGWIKGKPIPYVPGHNRSIRTFTIDPITGCWNWDGTPDELGYCSKTENGRSVGAHRWVYERMVGPIPDGEVPDHLCRNPRCVNPDHLEPVTQTENVRRGIHTKITRFEAELIRSLIGLRSHREIADIFGVSKWIVNDIARGKTWKPDVH